MKRESDQTFELQKQINQAFEDFIRVPKEQSADYTKAARSFFDIVATAYFQWFAIAFAEKIEKNPELLSDAFLASFKGEDNLLKIAERYDNRSSFFQFLNFCVNKRIQGITEKNQIDNDRAGIAKALTNSEERILKKLLKYQGEEGALDFWGESEYRRFCTLQGLDPDRWMKVQQIYLINLQIYATSNTQENDDREAYDIIDNDSANIHNIDVVEKEVIDRMFGKPDKIVVLLRFLDKQIYPRLPVARTIIWPELFTMDFTSEHINATWDRLKKNIGTTLTRSAVMDGYWDEIDMDGCRKQYGMNQYHFIVDWIFSYMIKAQKEISLAYLGERHRNCSAAYLSKERKLMQTQIRSLYGEIYNL